MKNITIIRVTLTLTIVLSAMYYSFIAFGLWASISAVVLLWGVWTVYCNWLNKQQRLNVERYIGGCSISESPLYEYSSHLTDFFLYKKQCDGQIVADHIGIHVMLDSAYRIEWENVKGITLITGADAILARLFLCNEVGLEVKDKLFVTWDVCFNDTIPNDVYFIDSRIGIH